MAATHLVDRGVIRVSGTDARSFLQGVLTNDMDAVTGERAGYGALLTPQGKIIADCLVVSVPDEEGGGFLLDAPLLQTADLMKRLSLYKLRAAVSLSDITQATAVIATTDGGTLPPETGLVFADPRLPALGDRALTDRDEAFALAPAEAEGYHAHRVALGIPEGNHDFTYGDAFPHEALLDQTGGVSFRKGCYVGQEVVSRMQHRGTARTRIVPIVFRDGLVPEAGVEASAGGKPLGRVGTCADGRGLAMLRLDRVADALAAGQEMTGGGVPFTLAPRPDFVRFPFPGEPGFGAAA